VEALLEYALKVTKNKAKKDVKNFIYSPIKKLNPVSELACKSSPNLKILLKYVLKIQYLGGKKYQIEAITSLYKHYTISNYRHIFLSIQDNSFNQESNW
jgi:hypothetical protein